MITTTATSGERKPLLDALAHRHSDMTTRSVVSSEDGGGDGGEAQNTPLAVVDNHNGSDVDDSSFYSYEQSIPLPPPPPPPPPRASSFFRDKTAVSSLDFERVVNDYSMQATRDRFLIPTAAESVAAPTISSSYSYYASIPHQETKHFGARDMPPPPATARPTKLSTKRTATRWILSGLIGLVTGMLTIFIVEITSTIIHWRIRILDTMAQSDRYPNSWVFAGFMGLNLILAVAASLLCIYVAPEGTGSGIPEVKALLNGCRVRRFSSWRLLGVKMLGTVLSVSSSLAVGMEGPLIHIGAIVGASFTKLASVLSRLLSTATVVATNASTNHNHNNHNSNHHHNNAATTTTISTESVTLVQRLWNFCQTNLAHFAIDAERRDFVAIGASVGFAASFGAPIGGLLFVLDDISSYFSKDMFLRTLVANAIGTFCLAVQSRDMSHYSIIDFVTYRGANPNDDIFLNRFEFLPLYILVGIGGGVLGGLFCTSYTLIKKKVAKQASTPSRQLLEVALLSILTSVLTFGLPAMAWTCKPPEPDDTGREFFCRSGEVNEMATMMLGSRTDAIKRILANPNQFQERTLWAVGILFYFLTTLTYGSTLPSGIFTPTVLIGASLGGAVGLAFQRCLTPNIIPSTFALLGVAAMLAGIQRSTVSVSVILVEGTGKIQVLLPVIIVVLVARYVAQQIHFHGVYELAMDLKHYPYLDHEEKKRYDIFQVSQIMSSPAEVIGPLEKASHLVRLLKDTSHNGYPVVHPRTKKFLGLVRRDQIIALLECGIFEEGDSAISDGTSDMAPSPLSTLSTPTPGIGKSPLMNLAYHIKDDRYDHIKSIDFSGDEFDRHEWLQNIHTSINTMPPNVAAGDADPLVPTAGDDTLPPLRRLAKIASRGKRKSLLSSTPVSSSNGTAGVKMWAKVGVDPAGNLNVTWLHPDCRDKYVNLAAVMNRGSFCVPDYLPVSKARSLFTNLGLRHVVVVGGDSGGEVVGIFTRANLMQPFIEEKTGIAL